MKGKGRGGEKGLGKVRTRGGGEEKRGRREGGREEDDIHAREAGGREQGGGEGGEVERYVEQKERKTKEMRAERAIKKMEPGVQSGEGETQRRGGGVDEGDGGSGVGAAGPIKEQRRGKKRRRLPRLRRGRGGHISPSIYLLN